MYIFKHSKREREPSSKMIYHKTKGLVALPVAFYKVQLLSHMQDYLLLNFKKFQ